MSSLPASLLSVIRLTAGYTATTQVLKDVSLMVNPGDLVALVGPNGSGKTTLLHCLTGFHKPQSGEVLLGDENVSRLSRRQIASRVAFVPQKTDAVFSYTAMQMVLMGRHPYAGFSACDGSDDVEIASASLARLQITHLADRPFSQISGGEKQLVLLARALAQQTSLLILDEPLTGLDLRHQYQLMDAIAGLTATGGKATLATFHDLTVAARWCNRMVLLKNGQILASGAPHKVITTDNLKTLYGVDATVHQMDDQSLYVHVYGCSDPGNSLNI